MTLDLFLPTSGDRLSYGAMVERRDGPSWLRDDDDDIVSSVDVLVLNYMEQYFDISLAYLPTV